MNKRWMRGPDAEVGGLLLKAGRADEPGEAKRRTLLAATAALTATSLAAGGAAATSLAAGGTATTKAGVASIVSLKWLLILGVSGAAAVTGAVALRDTRGAAPEVSQSAPATGVAPSNVAHVSAPPAPLVAQSPSAPVSTAVSAPASARQPAVASPLSPLHEGAAPLPSASSFEAEVSALDGARASIDSGRPAEALSLLDAYVARFPHGTMAPEATLLRIEALLRAGDRNAATRVADDFTARNPKSPYVTRLRTLFNPNP
jgi:hypothetical protein